MITFSVKLKQEEGNIIREKIRIDISQLCRDVKQVLTPSVTNSLHRLWDMQQPRGL